MTWPAFASSLRSTDPPGTSIGRWSGSREVRILSSWHRPSWSTLGSCERVYGREFTEQRFYLNSSNSWLVHLLSGHRGGADPNAEITADTCVDVCCYWKELAQCAHQNGLADTSDGLAGSRCGEVDGQVRQAQNRNQRQQALLVHKLLTMVICCVVTEYGFHKLHLRKTASKREQGNRKGWCIITCYIPQYTPNNSVRFEKALPHLEYNPLVGWVSSPQCPQPWKKTNIITIKTSNLGIRYLEDGLENVKEGVK